MEAELDASLGYEKNQKGDLIRTTSTTDTPQKPSKASMVNSKWRFPETAMVNLSQNLFPNIKEIYLVLKKKSSSYISKWNKDILYELKKYFNHIIANFILETILYIAFNIEPTK